jgi:formate dehydrogenase
MRPHIERYSDGQSTPMPSAIDFTPGELLGSVSGELGLREFLEKAGHTLVVTSDKDGAGSTFERELTDADVVISQPFWPAYLTAERIAQAPNLKLAITAGIGSDHVDLQAAGERGITVAEVTYCNSISVAEHVVMQILALVRNYLPSHQWVLDGGWNIADAVSRAYDVEGMAVGTVGAGRIGLAVLRRLKPFDVVLPEPIGSPTGDSGDRVPPGNPAKALAGVTRRFRCGRRSACTTCPRRLPHTPCELSESDHAISSLDDDDL